ncbi:MAG: hypothetical protein DMG37_16365 [Acidobacteria bacterium]|nr:MAG: hypothetical protein DMG37_16365 [Acidobacteriota bacterium]
MAHSWRADENKRLARLFLKPQASRYLGLVRVAEACLRPITNLFPPRPWDKTRGVEKILVFDPGALGDMLLLAPFLRRLRGSFPTSRIVLAGRGGPADFLQEQGLVDECISVEVPWTKRKTSRLQRNQPISWRWKEFFRSLRQLRKREFDLGFAAGWGGDIRGNLAIWLAGARRRVGYGYAGGEFLLTDVVEADLTRPHVVDRNLQLLERLGVESARQPVVPLQIPAAEARAAREFLARHGVGEKDLLIGVHPGAGSALREWGDDRFAEVARRASDQFGAKILWFNDPEKPRRIPADLQAIEVAVSFQQLQAVLSHCQVFLCNDSGPMHVAAALKIPVVAVFGPTQAEWFRPYGEGHQVVIRNDMWCRPCADRCRWKEPYCMRLITVEQVMEAITIIVNDTTQNRVLYLRAAGD